MSCNCSQQSVLQLVKLYNTCRLIVHKPMEEENAADRTIAHVLSQMYHCTEVMSQ